MVLGFMGTVCMESCASVLQRPNAAVQVFAQTDLTGRERRKQRNERRLELAASRKLIEKESLETKPGRRKKSEHSLEDLAKMGMQWYTLRVFTNNEMESMEALRSTLKDEFPDTEFEVWSPIVPTESVVRGKTRFAMNALLKGHVFIRCVLDGPVYRRLLNERSVFRFVGAFPYKMKAGLDTKMVKGGYPDAHVPAPVPRFQIDALRAEVAKKEEEFKLLQEEKKKREEEFKLLQKEKKNENAAGAVSEMEKLGLDECRQQLRELREGDAVQVIGGPYQNFQGTILEFLPAGKVLVIVPVFGTDTEIELDSSDLVLSGG